jgi:hypothetical protein
MILTGPTRLELQQKIRFVQNTALAIAVMAATTVTSHGGSARNPSTKLPDQGAPPHYPCIDLLRITLVTTLTFIARD